MQEAIQIKDINSAPAYSITCDGSNDVRYIKQIMLFCRYVNFDGQQEEILDLIPVKGQIKVFREKEGLCSS